MPNEPPDESDKPSHERRLLDLKYLREELEREERAKSQVIPDGTEADFRSLLDFACVTTVQPSAPASPAPPDKPASASAPEAD